jgi:hypothetical protein
MFARPAFPWPVAAGRDSSVLGVPPSFTPRRYRQRMSGRGQVSDTTWIYVIAYAILLSTKPLGASTLMAQYKIPMW